MSPLLLAGYFLGAGLLTAGLNWLGLIPWRRTRGEHWTERARELHPVRLAAGINQYVIPGCAVLFQLAVISGSRGQWPWVLLASWLGAVFGGFGFDHEVFPWLSWRKWVRLAAITLVLRSIFWVAFVGAIVAMPSHFDDFRTWGIGLALVGMFMAFNYGAGIRLLVWLHCLRPPPERLARIVHETSARLDVPVRGVWLIRDSAATAYAVTTTGELLFGERLLELHPDDEIAAICIHELSHLNEPRRILLGRIVGSFTLLPLAFVRPAYATWEFAGLLGVAALIGALRTFGFRVAKRMEHQADDLAAKNEGEAGTYARALVRLYESNQMPAVTRRSRIHPDLYDRMLSAGVTPDFPRPEPPEGVALNGLLAGLLFGALIGYVLISHRYPW